MWSNLVKLCVILLVTSKISFAILVGSSQSSVENVSKSDALKSGSPDGEITNTTFYYEANEFLNPKKPQRNDNDTKPPASIAMTSGRNGRMMDLDALVGDYAASQSNKNKKLTGERQSRFVSAENNLNLPAGKKLHIQGFIPIIGVKDVGASGEDEDVESSSSDQHHNQQQLAKQSMRAIQSLTSITGNDLPYSQSSIGHATFGVQRYLNSEPAQMQQYVSIPDQSINQQVDSKNSAASNILETLKRPIKKMTGLPQAETSLTSQQNCLCVPFYMCKNGYIVESSLGKSQIQQMIQLQQQQQQQQQQLNQPNQFVNQQQIEMKSGQLLTRQPQQLQQPQAVLSNQYGSDSYAQVDERSLDKDIITMSPLLSSTAFIDQNQTAELVGSNDLNLNQQDVQKLNQTQLEELANSLPLNGSLENEYSQEILGRMLGLKNPLSKVATQVVANPLQRQQQAAIGACGLLRTCCNIPIGLATSSVLQPLHEPSYQNVAYSSAIVNNKQQIQRYQQQHRPQMSTTLSQPLYGLPNQISRGPQPPVMSYNNYVSSSVSQEALAPLAHRTSQQLVNNRYQSQAQSNLAQYSRANPAVDRLQQVLAQQQKLQVHQMIPNGQSVSSIARQNILQPTNSLLGSRKILEGRCGLRQSSGINGRVQNLQYHESSADFGEYPAQAAILKRLGGSDSLFVCGGTLISQYWLATAAHCIKKHSHTDLKVRLGEWDVHRDDEFYPHVEKEIRDVVIHPEFVAGNLVNDIALLRLDSPVDTSLPHVNPACLPTIDESFARQNCFVTGWGKDSFGQKGSFQAVLKEVELPVVGQGECEQALRATRLGPHYRLHSGFICAGGEGGKDACEGDGGSGLYCVQDGVVKVAGLVSWGIGCGQAGVPGVYVNMAHYRPWIENIISIDEDIYSPLSNVLGSSSLISERNNEIKSDNVTTSNQEAERSAELVVIATNSTTNK